MKTNDAHPSLNGETDKLPEEKTKSKCPGWMQVNKPLVPLKVVLTCWFGAYASLMPFITVHLRERGLTVGETSAIYTFMPIPQLVGPPLAGIVADKIGRYKPVLLISLLMCIFIATGILFIPKIPSNECPHTSATLICGMSRIPHLTVAEQKCDSSFNRTIHLNITHCFADCHSSQFEIVENSTNLCFGADNDRVCETISLNITELHNLTLEAQVASSVGYQDNGCDYTIRSVRWNNESSLEDNCFHSYHQHSNCSLYCDVRHTASVPESDQLIKQRQCEEHRRKRIASVTIAFVLLMVFQVFLNICFRFLDVSALTMAKDHNSDFGRQRMWATLSSTIFAPLSGYLIDVISKQKGHTDYLPAFYIFDSFAVVTGIMVIILDIKIVAPGKNMWRKSFTLLRNPEAVLFVMAIFCLGTMWGFTETFLPWFLIDLNSPKYLIGLTTTVGGVVSLPILLTSEWWFKKVGRVNIIIIAFFVYLVRCFGYSYLTNPWWSLLFETQKVFSYYLMWVSAVTYSSSLSPKGLLATVQGFTGGLHFGIGRGSGGLIGGNIMSMFGARVAFRAMGIACGTAGLLYAGIYYFWIVRFRQLKERAETENDKKNPKELEVDIKNPQEQVTSIGMIEKVPETVASSEEQKKSPENSAKAAHTHL